MDFLPYVERDWDAMQRAKDEAWLEAYRRTTPAQRVRRLEELSAGKGSRALDSLWRDEDLDDHLHLIELLRRFDERTTR